MTKSVHCFQMSQRDPCAPGLSGIRIQLSSNMGAQRDRGRESAWTSSMANAQCSLAADDVSVCSWWRQEDVFENVDEYIDD